MSACKDITRHCLRSNGLSPGYKPKRFSSSDCRSVEAKRQAVGGHVILFCSEKRTHRIPTSTKSNHESMKINRCRNGLMTSKQSNVSSITSKNTTPRRSNPGTQLCTNSTSSNYLSRNQFLSEEDGDTAADSGNNNNGSDSTGNGGSGGSGGSSGNGGNGDDWSGGSEGSGGHGWLLALSLAVLPLLLNNSKKATTGVSAFNEALSQSMLPMASLVPDSSGSPSGSNSPFPPSSSSQSSSRGGLPSNPTIDSLFEMLAKLFHALTGGKESDRTSSSGLPDLLSPSARQHLLDEATELVVERLQSETGDDSVARRAEVGALRRLQREAFADLLKLRERVDKLDWLARTRAAQPRPATSQSLGTHVVARVTAGAAFLPAPELERQVSRAALDLAGMRTGLSLVLTAVSRCRGGVDELACEAATGLGEASTAVMLGGPITLHKVHYKAAVRSGVTLHLAPMGVTGHDVITDTLHPLKDGGLTRFSSEGPALHSCAHGSAVGVTLSLPNSASLSAAQFLSGWGMPPNPGMMQMGDSAALCSSSLLHAALQPTAGLRVAASALRRHWPSPPSPTSGALHWSEMGPLVLPKLHLFPHSSPRHTTSAGSSKGSGSTDTAVSGVEGGLVPWESQLPSSGASVSTVGASASLDTGRGAVLAGWVQREHADEWVEGEQSGAVQWQLSLSNSLPSWKNSSTLGWGFNVGQSRPPSGLLEDGADEDEVSSSGQQPLQLEAFLSARFGKGFNLQPGVVATAQGGKIHQALMLRSNWTL